MTKVKRRSKKKGAQPGPYFKSKRQASRPQHQTTLHVKSKATGLAHTFENMHGWESIMQEFEVQKASEQGHILNSLPFYNWLRDQKINPARLSVKYGGPGFRFANPKYGPLTIVGSVGDGGRFNPGSAQMHMQFPYVKNFGCLYLASSKECAQAEAAQPIGVHKMFEVKPNKELLLWNLQAVIEDLDFVNLLEVVRQSYGEQLWNLIKVPVISQILGQRLKFEGGNGIMFESTKHTGHHNIALFFDTDDDAKIALTASQI